MEIRVLHRQGMGIRAIARELGMSRKTVRRYLEAPDARRYGPRAARPTKLSPFEAYLRERIEAARPDPVVRFETAPGEQLQADFTYVRKGKDPLLAFVATLGYSRATFVRFTRDESATTLVECVRAALAYFGGVPKEILFDNPKTVVIERDAYGEGEHRFHRDLLALSGEYGFRIRLCRPYRAKTKGKVERFNGYLKSSLLVPLAATLKQSGLKLDAIAANAHVGPWLEGVANVRMHATTGEKPSVRLVIERQHLAPLPILAHTPPTTPLRRTVRPMPFESLQHPLSTYEQLLRAA